MKCMTVEQIEERRSNLAFIRENAPLNELDDHTFTTTLKMQEEWLATIDAARLTIAAVRASAVLSVCRIHRGHRDRCDRPACVLGRGILAILEGE